MKCIPSHVRAFHPECIRSNHPISAITTLPWHFKKMTWYAECKTVSWPCPFNLNEDSKLVMKKTFLLCTTVSLSHLRTMLPESSSRPLPSKRPNHATWSLFYSKSLYVGIRFLDSPGLHSCCAAAAARGAVRGRRSARGAAPPWWAPCPPRGTPAGNSRRASCSDCNDREDE